MDTKIFHGDLTPDALANMLTAHFNRGNYQVQRIGDGKRLAVQIATREKILSGGPTALTVTMEKVSDGVSVQLSKQAWFGIAASMGITALGALKNPWSLLERIDDLAQDLESLQLQENVLQALEDYARQHGTGYVLSERLQRLVCPYCLTANPVGTPSCLACGAPLGESQPTTCPNCGFILDKHESTCPNCGKALK